MKPDFSPAMLRFFLRARAAHAAAAKRGRSKREMAATACKVRLRRMAGITNAEFDMAWMGRLLRPEPRRRLWRALGHVPADYGVTLTHGGQSFDTAAAQPAQDEVACHG